MSELADAIRKVTAADQEELDKGRRSRHIDADDLVGILLAIADELDPPFVRQHRAGRTALAQHQSAGRDVGPAQWLGTLCFS